LESHFLANVIGRDSLRHVGFRFWPLGGDSGFGIAPFSLPDTCIGSLLPPAALMTSLCDHSSAAGRLLHIWHSVKMAANIELVAA
jgi:hypothetical protein